MYYTVEIDPYEILDEIDLDKIVHHLQVNGYAVNGEGLNGETMFEMDDVKEFVNRLADAMVLGNETLTESLLRELVHMSTGRILP